MHTFHLLINKIKKSANRLITQSIRNARNATTSCVLVGPMAHIFVFQRPLDQFVFGDKRPLIYQQSFIYFFKILLHTRDYDWQKNFNHLNLLKFISHINFIIDFYEQSISYVFFNFILTFAFGTNKSG